MAHLLDCYYFYKMPAVLELFCLPFELTFGHEGGIYSLLALFGPMPSFASDDSSKEFLHSPFPEKSTGEQEPQVFILWGLGDGVDHDEWISAELRPELCRYRHELHV